MADTVQDDLGDELGPRSNWQTGRGVSITPSASNCRKKRPHDEDTSHLADVHATGASPCPCDMRDFKDVQTMGK